MVDRLELCIIDAISSMQTSSMQTTAQVNNKETSARSRTYSTSLASLHDSKEEAPCGGAGATQADMHTHLYAFGEFLSMPTVQDTVPNLKQHQEPVQAHLKHLCVPSSLALCNMLYHISSNRGRSVSPQTS